MTYLLDTNACIRFLNGRSEPLRQRILLVAAQEVALCSIVKAELYYGARKSRNPSAAIAKQRQFVDAFVSFPFDDNAADAYGTIRADLESKGGPIGPNDLLIASIAISNDLILVTHNTREFERVQGLKFADWEVEG